MLFKEPTPSASKNPTPTISKNPTPTSSKNPTPTSSKNPTPTTSKNENSQNNDGSEVVTGKSLSGALIFASTNPQYDDRLFIHYKFNT